MGSMQRQAGFNVVSYRVLPQFVAFTLKLVAIVIAGFTVLILINSLGFEPAEGFCEETGVLTNSNQTTTAKINWCTTIISGTWGASMLYILHKDMQMKGGATAKVISMTPLMGAADSYPISSPLEDNWTFFDWVFSLLPDFVKQDLRLRVPSGDFEELDIIDVLHFQYNLVVFLLVFCLFIILCSCIIMVVFRYSVKYRESIANKSVLLSKLIPSKNMANILIIVLKACVVVSIMTCLVGVHFMFTHPFEFIALIS